MGILSIYAVNIVCSTMRAHLKGADSTIFEKFQTPVLWLGKYRTRVTTRRGGEAILYYETNPCYMDIMAFSSLHRISYIYKERQRTVFGPTDCVQRQVCVYVAM